MNNEKRLSLYQMLVSQELDDVIVNYVQSTKNSTRVEYFTTVYDSYLRRLNNLKRITVDWEDHYSKLMYRAVEGATNGYLGRRNEK